MRCVAYVSRTTTNDRGISLPTGLSEIVRISRRRNSSLQITGVLSYRQGQYFQVLEGSRIEVENLMSKISSDPRHQDLSVFLDVPVTERSFDSWNVSVFEFVDQTPIFKKFIEHHQQLLNALTEVQKKRLQPFIDLEGSTIKTTHNYEGKHLRLLAWPDLNLSRKPELIMNLCVKMTNKPYAFDDLVKSKDFGTQQQVTDIIAGFDAMGILTVTEPELSTEFQPELIDQQNIHAKKPNKFYSAIKRFLRMG